MWAIHSVYLLVNFFLFILLVVGVDVGVGVDDGVDVAVVNGGGSRVVFVATAAT